MKLPLPRIGRDESCERFDTAELETALVGGAADLAERWLRTIPHAQEMVHPGDRVLLEVTLAPQQGIALFLVNAEGTRSLLASRQYAAATLH